MVLDWTAFDAKVAQAQANGVEILFNVWLTPAWASIAADQVGGSNNVIGPWNVAGESAVPSNMQFVKDITTAVLTRAASLGRPLKYIEVLNEPEFHDAATLASVIAGGGKPFWTGTAAQAVEFAWAAYSAAHAYDPTITVLMPSQYDPNRLTTYLSAIGPSGKYGKETFDYLNLHPYRATATQVYSGEDLKHMSANRIGVDNARRIMAAAGIDKPIAVTEWGIDTFTTSSLITNFNALSAAERKKYIIRLLVMAAMLDVRLFCIFSNGNIAGDYVNDTAGVIAAVTEVHNTIAGKTIIAGGWYADGRVTCTTDDSVVHEW